MKWRSKSLRDHSRSFKRQGAAMKERARKSVEKEVETQLKLIGLKEFVRQGLHEFVVSAGMTALDELLEEERTAVCGRRYAHLRDRTARRGGRVGGELVLGGRRVHVKRPRARSVDGRELTLPSWK